MIACPLKIEKGRRLEDELNLLLSKGFARILINGEVKFIEEFTTSTIAPVSKGDWTEKSAIAPKLKAEKVKQSKKSSSSDVKGEVEILIDRAVVNAQDEDITFRLSDSVQTAFFEGHGDCHVYIEGQCHQNGVLRGQRRVD